MRKELTDETTREHLLNGNRVWLRVREFADLFGFPVSSVYAQITAGEIEVIRVGHAVRIPIAPLRKKFGL